MLKFLKVIIASAIIFACSQSSFTQQLEIEGNNSSASPLLELQSLNDTSNIVFKTKTGLSNYSIINDLKDSGTFGIFFGDQPRLRFNNNTSSFEHYAKDGTPILKIDNTQTPNSYILFKQEPLSDPDVINIRAFDNEVTEDENRLSLSAGGDHQLFIEKSSTIIADSPFQAGQVGEARFAVSHEHDVGYNHLDLEEDGDTNDYTRIGFYNKDSDDYFNISARPGHSNKELTISFNAVPIITMEGPAETVGIGVNNPTYKLQLPNQSAPGSGQGQAFNWATYSDRRVKSNIQDLEKVDLKILNIKPVTYKHHDSLFEDDIIISKENWEQSYGFVAQELYEIFPETVSRPDDEEKELWSVNYNELIPVLIKSMQDLQARINERESKINEIIAKIESLD